MFWKRKKQPPKSYFPAKDAGQITAIIPDDWICLGIGQSPVHCLWFCTLFNMVTKDYRQVEEYDTPNEALAAAIELIDDASASDKQGGE